MLQMLHGLNFRGKDAYAVKILQHTAAETLVSFLSSPANKEMWMASSFELLGVNLGVKTSPIMHHHAHAT